MQIRRNNTSSISSDRNSIVHKLVYAAALAVANCARAGWTKGAMTGRPTSLAGSTMSTEAHTDRRAGDARGMSTAGAQESSPLVKQSNAKSGTGKKGKAGQPQKTAPNMAKAPPFGAAAN